MPENLLVHLNEDIKNLSDDIFSLLLKDKTTNSNILNTETYTSYNSIPKLTPRCLRNKDENKKRSKDKAEIFTPIHIVKRMNDLVIEEYNKENHSFDDYVDSTQLEITCGEGVFLCTRYDSETGSIIPIEDRVGLLDRKLQRLCEKINDKQLFLEYMIRIAKSIYGYEYQGDSLLMARSNILYSFMEYYNYKFKENLSESSLLELSEIIVWNIFQMDGLTMCIPQKDVVKTKGKNYKAINGVFVKIYNWKENKIEYFDIHNNN
jgi:type II restriction enzyme